MKTTLLILQRRCEKNLSLRDLKKMTGISRSVLGNYENNIISPHLDQLAIIADALDLNITDLFTVK